MFLQVTAFPQTGPGSPRHVPPTEHNTFPLLRRVFRFQKVRILKFVGGMTEDRVIQSRMPVQLHILQLLLGHAEIMTQFMYESLANLMTDFSFG
jgi:hypothetical protein